MGWFQGLGAAIVSFLGKVLMAILLLVVIAATISWARSNPRQAQATTNKVMTAGASTIGWAADGVTSMTGGSAAHDGGAVTVETIWVENKAPARWQVGRAMQAWNKGLVGAQLKVGPCHSGSPCIRVTQEALITPAGESLILGRTSTFFGTKIRFNAAAAGHVSAAHLAYASCHEFGHALGVQHSASRGSCMFPSAKGAATKPSRADFDAVNAQYGR